MNNEKMNRRIVKWMDGWINELINGQTFVITSN